MEREGRLPKKKNEDDDDEEEEVQDQDLTLEELQKKKEAEEDFKQPIVEDCFEYKLVGVNVHSGSANGGHYYSYINTNRGTDETENDPSWLQTENDPWMEFNDSRVSDYKFEKLDDDVTGEGAGKTTSYSSYGYGNAWSSSSTTYGKSAYMLFYERRTKKDMKVLIPESQIDQEKKNGIQVNYDEEKKEYSKLVKYRESADNEKPNEIYK